ncbi:hypothetical protein HMN09_00871000 [Mycena chlorophos]|uniref:Uncharacterized protein n=1 Tax=Mycena chlorophos TaxID=658473 RepID=A0A8H6SN57_MYCCL|nr:hypothetical protein HMN09_00871000 [Mycena chlorophos]
MRRGGGKRAGWAEIGRAAGLKGDGREQSHPVPTIQYSRRRLPAASESQQSNKFSEAPPSDVAYNLHVAPPTDIVKHALDDVVRIFPIACQQHASEVKKPTQYDCWQLEASKKAVKATKTFPVFSSSPYIDFSPPCAVPRVSLVSTTILGLGPKRSFAGALAAVGLSAVLGFQTFLYFKIFPSDVTKYKLFVPWIWLIDAAHTVVVCLTIWDYAIVNYANPSIAEHIPPTLPVNVALTAVMTLSVNMQVSSQRSIDISPAADSTAPGYIEGIIHPGVAFVSTFGMLTKKTFTAFSPTYQRYLIIGLSISAATDIVISAARYYFLRNLQQGYPGAQEIVDVVVVFTLNDGCLTSSRWPITAIVASAYDQKGGRDRRVTLI